MPWFERPLLTVARRECAAAMRFAEDDASAHLPTPPAEPCQLYVHAPFCAVLCPLRLPSAALLRIEDASATQRYFTVHFRLAFSPRCFAALRREIALHHDAGLRFCDVYMDHGTPTVDADPLIEALLDATRHDA